MSLVRDHLEAAKWRVDSAHDLIIKAQQVTDDPGLLLLVKVSRQLVRLVNEAIEAEKQKRTGGQ